MLGGFLDRFGGAKEKLEASIARAANRKGNKEILEGKVAAQMLMAYADHDCSTDEEQEALDTLNGDRMLQGAGFGPNQILETWQKMLAYRPERPTGKMQLKREITEAMQHAKDPTIGEDIFLGACNIAYADNKVKPSESTMLIEIAKVCGVKPEALGIDIRPTVNADGSPL